MTLEISRYKTRWTELLEYSICTLLHNIIKRNPAICYRNAFKKGGKFKILKDFSATVWNTKNHHFILQNITALQAPLPMKLTNVYK